LNDVQIMPFVGTPRQVRWAREIVASLAALYPDTLLPDVPYAGWWIDHRDQPPDSLMQRAEQTEQYEPFTFSYPAHHRGEADATLARIARCGDRWAVLDLESSGVGRDAEICDLAIVRGSDGEPLAASLIQPPHPERAAVCSGIPLSRFQVAPVLSEVWGQVANLLSTHALVSYNAPYDARLLRREARRSGLNLPPFTITCAMRLASVYLETDDWLKLHETAESLGIDPQRVGRLHTALADAKLCAAVVRQMMDTSATH
jgi:DNA polymerase III epsilon subunit-like protein